MAYIIGILSEDEEAELIRRGWEVEEAPGDLIPADNVLEENGEEADRYKMVWVDNSMFEVMDGPDWEKGE